MHIIDVDLKDRSEDLVEKLAARALAENFSTLGITKYSIDTLAVNEQNPRAKGFYEYMCFEVYKRTEYDEQRKPYPLLYMKRG